MATRQSEEEARYLQDHGMGFRQRRQSAPKPPRGTIPIVQFEGQDWDSVVEPHIHAHATILDKIDALFAHPNYARLQQYTESGQALAEAPELLAFYDELQAARTERIRIEQVLAPFWNDAPVVAQVPMRELPNTHPCTALALHLLTARQTGRAASETTPQMEEAEQREILRHFRNIFGVRVGEAWALAFVAEVQRAALDQQNARLRQANLREKELARFADGAPPSDPTAHATLVLKRAAEAMADWPIQFELPAWLDAPLTAYYVGRFNFERGGGAGRKISGATLLKLVTNPEALTKDIEKSKTAATVFATNLDAVRRREPINARVTTRG